MLQVYLYRRVLFTRDPSRRVLQSCLKSVQRSRLRNAINGGMAGPGGARPCRAMSLGAASKEVELRERWPINKDHCEGDRRGLRLLAGEPGVLDSCSGQDSDHVRERGVLTSLPAQATELSP